MSNNSLFLFTHGRRLEIAQKLSNMFDNNEHEETIIGSEQKDMAYRNYEDWSHVVIGKVFLSVTPNYFQ
jgi:hypothetical protein